ncbi:hypothetical protein [Zavarzinella formosa]|uniref:hypothetical protein n=1 Tax=Zavarzinella formosa TaxID=360055 RepID=UPI00037C5D18|nr:hypothetical protein [Zavarzinella formosa]
MPNFADNYQHQCLLEISRRHREAVDPARICDGKVIGQDNWDKLAVSTVFAAIAIEAALNDYVLSHCLLLDVPYLQEVFGEITGHFLRGSVQNKLKLLTEQWPDPFPDQLLKEVRELIRIRNRIAHQSSEFRTANETTARRGQMSNRSLSADEICHMLRHHEIARDFLGRFWLPGNREFQQGLVSPEQAERSVAADRGSQVS